MFVSYRELPTTADGCQQPPSTASSLTTAPLFGEASASQVSWRQTVCGAKAAFQAARA
jgi:hypothetical protein